MNKSELRPTMNALGQVIGEISNTMQTYSDDTFTLMAKHESPISKAKEKYETIKKKSDNLKGEIDAYVKDSPRKVRKVIEEQRVPESEIIPQAQH